MATMDNLGHVKGVNSGLLGGQIADGVAMAESKFLSLILLHLIPSQVLQYFRFRVGKLGFAEKTLLF